MNRVLIHMENVLGNYDKIMSSIKYECGVPVLQDNFM